MKRTRKEAGLEMRITRSAKSKLSTKSPSPSKKLKSPVPTRKFFKSKAAGTAKTDVSLKIGKVTPRFLQAKPKLGRVSKKVRPNDSVFGLKPTTLKAASKVDPMLKRTLRPRKSAKNYCEDSKLISKPSTSVSESKANSPKVEKLSDGRTEKKAPIYESARRTEVPAKGEAEVYEFLAEDEPGDQRQGRGKRKAPRKPVVKKPQAKPAKSKSSVKPADAGERKEGVTKKALVVLSKEEVVGAKDKQKTMARKNNIDGKESKVAKEGVSKLPVETDNFLVPRSNGIRQRKVRDETTGNRLTTKNGVQAGVEKKPAQNEKVQEGPKPASNTNTENVETSTNVQENSPDFAKHSALTPISEQENILPNKPRIISIENLGDNSKTPLLPTPAKTSAEFRPFRTTNVFTSRPTMQYKNMMNHSLLNKSLSPIKKVLENFDAGSPWRPPVVPTFSQVRSLVQSTPQSNLSRITASKKKEAMGMKMNAILENNENGSKQIPVKNSKKELPVLSPRKFGTVISNIDSNVQLKNNYNAKTSVDLTNNNNNNNNNVPLQSRKSAQKEPSPRNSVERKSSVSIQSIPEPIESVTIADETTNVREDKENAAPNYQTPKPSPKKNVPSATRSKENTIPVSKENLEPRAGPSGLQRVDIEQKATRQTNLDKFLGKPEMPESTSIRTPHGIFDDAHSTPIFGKRVKKVSKKVPDLANAFGFDEDESDDIDVSPIVPSAPKQATREPAKKLQVPGQSRPKGQQKEKVQPKPIRLPVQQIKKKVENPEEDVRPTEEAPKRQFDVISFSDTFDVLSENGELPERKEAAEVPLFQDLEPTHFNKPPRHSYKRKRAVKFSFSDPDSGEEQEDEDDPKPERKRKRGRLNKQEEKKIKDWVKSINSTFQEIDQYDLVVE